MIGTTEPIDLYRWCNWEWSRRWDIN